MFKIEAAKIGREAFLDPEMVIEPDNFFLPLMISFCIR
jgi:hypothetical protein